MQYFQSYDTHHITIPTKLISKRQVLYGIITLANKCTTSKLSCSALQPFKTTSTEPWLNVSAQLTIRVYLTEVARPHSQGGFCD